MEIQTEISAMGERAVTASRVLASLSARRKNVILQAMADELDARGADIKAANEEDMQNARQSGLSEAMLDRLKISDSRLAAMIKGVRDIAGQKDPVGSVISRWIRPNGLEILKIRVPIGVIGIIYESRPNVTVDSSALCFKSSNAVILRGGREAAQSNAALVAAMQAGGARKGMPADAVQLVSTTDRAAIQALVQLEGRVDLVIPRGGEGLIRTVMEHARVPVIKHYRGVCHVYIDADADANMALAIVENAKCQRPGVCNAIEKLLVHETIAPQILPVIAARLRELNVELRGDDAARAIVPDILPATESDWTEEYLDMILTIGIVKSDDAAIDHINRYGSHHSDAIVSNNTVANKKFCVAVDSAAVYVNASTRFTDGGEFGMGAEIGISTDKIHARGPMGVEELTTYKYVVRGKGQVRD